MRRAIIRATGSYAPERVLPNSYFNDLLGTDVDTWLRNNVEIYERRWCHDDQATSDLCVAAAERALKAADLEASDLDLVIVATDTPDYLSPSTAAVVQHKLGAVNAGSFDINTACAGFVTALDFGSKFLQADPQYDNILVIGAYAMSKYLNMQDKKTVTLFADGAGAVLLSASDHDDQGVLATELISKGEFAEWMGIYGGGTRHPISDRVVAHHDHQLRFVHRFPPELNPNMWSSMAQRLFKRLDITADDVDHFLITQININSIRETMDRLNQPHNKAHTIMHHHGYTGSACIPMAFDDALSKGLIKRGDLLVFLGSGGGLAFASAAVRY